MKIAPRPPDLPNLFHQMFFLLAGGGSWVEIPEEPNRKKCSSSSPSGDRSVAFDSPPISLTEPTRTVHLVVLRDRQKKNQSWINAPPTAAVNNHKSERGFQDLRRAADAEESLSVPRSAQRYRGRYHVPGSRFPPRASAAGAGQLPELLI